MSGLGSWGYILVGCREEGEWSRLLGVHTGRMSGGG